MTKYLWTLAVALACFPAWHAFAQIIPDGYVVPPNTISKDHRYGVTVLKVEKEDKISKPQNSVIDLQTGKLLGAIQTEEVAADHMNHDEIAPTLWAADDSMLLWQVDGKWGFSDEVLLSLADGHVKWQANLLNLLQQEMLKRTRNASPKKYAAVKKENAGWGSWYKDGFSIDCVLAPQNGPLTFPLRYKCYLSSQPKDGDNAKLNARMTGEVAADGTINVTDFHLGNQPPARNW